MNVQFLNPFVEAAFEVLAAETELEMKRGELKLDRETYITSDVTVIISLVGQIEGNVFFSMDKETALKLASRMMGEKFDEFDMLAQSGVAELGNVITGRAGIKLAKNGYAFNISPPTLIMGAGSTVSTLDYPRLLVPMFGSCGMIHIHLALRETARPSFNTAQTPVVAPPQLG